MHYRLRAVLVLCMTLVPLALLHATSAHAGGTLPVAVGGDAVVWLEWNDVHRRAAGKITNIDIPGASRVTVQVRVPGYGWGTVSDSGRWRLSGVGGTLSTPGFSYIPGREYRACGWRWNDALQPTGGPACVDGSVLR